MRRQLGKPRTLSYRMPDPGEGEHRPEPGDFLVVEATGTTYRVLRASHTRSTVAPWDGPPPDPLAGVVTRILHFRLEVLRIDPAERPEDAMTWGLVWDRRRR